MFYINSHTELLYYHTDTLWLCLICEVTPARSFAVYVPCFHLPQHLISFFVLPFLSQLPRTTIAVHGKWCVMFGFFVPFLKSVKNNSYIWPKCSNVTEILAESWLEARWVVLPRIALPQIQQSLINQKHIISTSGVTSTINGHYRGLSGEVRYLN